MEDFSESGKDKQVSDKSFWPQLSLAAAGMTSAIAGSNTPGFTWLLYLGAGIIVLALIIMVWSTFLGRITKGAINKSRDKRLLAKYDDEYWSTVKKLSIFKKRGQSKNTVVS